MDKKTETSLSKFMTKLLRHTPQEYGLVLNDVGGSCSLIELLAVLNNQPKWIWVTKEHIDQVVSNCEKQRFEINGQQIRARYGHSRNKVRYDSDIPPRIVFHGTNTKAAPLILQDGIRSMNRQYVHLSEGRILRRWREAEEENS